MTSHVTASEVIAPASDARSTLASDGANPAKGFRKIRRARMKAHYL